MILSISEYLPSGPLAIIGTILSTIGIIIFITSSTFKNKNKVVLSQSFAHCFLIFAQAVEGGWSGIVQDGISLVRNICVYFKKNTKKVIVILITLALTVGIYANLFTTNFFTPWKGLELGPWYGYLPVLANFEYSVVILKKDIDVKWIKLSFAISNFLWGTTFLLMGKSLFLSGILNAITGTVSLVSFFIVCFKKDKQKEVSAMAVVLFGDDILSTNEMIYGKDVLSLPKGHKENNESLIETAIRECFEETNIIVTKENLIKELTPYSYEFLNSEKKTIKKTIVPFLFEIGEIGNPISKEERMLSVQWIKIDEFLDKCTFDNVREVVKEAIDKRCD